MKFPEYRFRVFFSPEEQVVAKFLDAVRANPKDAWAFVSAVYSPRLDLDALKEVLGSGAKIMAGNAVHPSCPKNCITRSLYVENAAENTRRLLHLRMVKNGGAWKIFGVEQETL
ncbi:MAG: hypothetical protein FWC70_12465 [Defluviitaleaceae bacterium]|nr:hypothetical protein [Defluviitaleaceae bacterium]